MIEKILGYKVGQLFFPCIEEAQKHELEQIFNDTDLARPDARLHATGLDPAWIAGVILKHQERILDILTTTPTSKVKARKINGAKKIRKSIPKEQTQHENNPNS